MSLDHILLGMLDQPASGYDLGRRFEESARMFWFAELSQVYPTLKKLESRGLLTSREAPSTRGPKKRVYRRTAAGTRALQAWLRGRPEITTQKLPFVAQLFFLGQLEDLEASTRFVEALRTEIQALMARYQAIDECRRARFSADDEASDVEFHEYAALRAGIHVARARIEWCDETLAALERRRERARRPGVGAREAVGSA